MSTWDVKTDNRRNIYSMTFLNTLIFREAEGEALLNELSADGPDSNRNHDDTLGVNIY
jgi:hypothetical protein